jgi:hypothetical protein
MREPNPSTRSMLDSSGGSQQNEPAIAMHAQGAQTSLPSRSFCAQAHVSSVERSRQGKWSTSRRSSGAGLTIRI